MTESGNDSVKTPGAGGRVSTAAPGDMPAGEPAGSETREKRPPGGRRKELIIALSAIVGAAIAALVIFIFTGTVTLRAEKLTRALIDGDGEAAVSLLPDKVLAQAALEAGTGEDEAKKAIARRLGAAVSDYGPVGKPKAKAGDARELAGRELEAILDLYAQIGLEPSGAVTVDVAVTNGDTTADVPVTMVKLGILWYADYTSLDDIACRIAGVGK